MKGKTLSMLLLTLSGLGWMISRGASAATPQPEPDQPWTGSTDNQWDRFGSPWGNQYPSSPTYPQQQAQPTGPEQEQYSDMSMPRGIRNMNPGNIRHGGGKWQGMAEVQGDPEYIQFVSPVYGIRAMGKLLLNYQSMYGLKTIREIINRWAPPIENETTAYVRHVSSLMGWPEDYPITVAGVLPKLVKAIILHENGVQPYNDKTINEGLALI